MAKKPTIKKVSASSDSQPTKATRREKNNNNKSKDTHPELQTNYMKNSIIRLCE